MGEGGGQSHHVERQLTARSFSDQFPWPPRLAPPRMPGIAENLLLESIGERRKFCAVGLGCCSAQAVDRKDLAAKSNGKKLLVVERSIERCASDGPTVERGNEARARSIGVTLPSVVIRDEPESLTRAEVCRSDALARHLVSA